MTNVLIKKGNSETETHTGRTPCEEEGGDWSDATEVKECQRLPANHQKLGEARNRFLPHGPQKEPTLPTL